MIALEIAIIALLVLFNGVLALSELAIVSARRTKLNTLAESGSRKARKAIKLADDPGRFLSTVQVGITLVGILAGTFGGATIADNLGRQLQRLPLIGAYGEAIAVTLVVLAITYLSVVVGELVPKRIALRNPEGIACIVAGPMLALSRIASPLVWLLDKSSEVLFRLLGMSDSQETQASQDDIRQLISVGTKTGVFSTTEGQMLIAAMRLGDRLVHMVMTPRTEIVFMEPGMTIDEAVKIVQERPHAYYPVAEDTLDKVVGIADSRRILHAGMEKSAETVQHVMEQPMFVPDVAPALTLLDEFRTSGAHLKIVVDEYGSVVGQVTPWNLLRAIFGDLQPTKASKQIYVEEHHEGSFIVDGLMPLDEFAEQFNLQPEYTEDVEAATTGGLVTNTIGRIPRQGEETQIGPLRIRVLKLDGFRVEKVRVELHKNKLDSDFHE